jgi:hypothetical protein
MKKLFNTLLISFISFLSFAQNTTPQPCTDLFFSELTFGKNPNGQIWDLNYAVEIFNPTTNNIDLSNYSLQLTNSIGSNTFITLSGTIAPHDVFVVSNSNADLNLQSLADQLTSGLDFESTVILSLVRNGNVIDKIGQNGPPTSGSIDITQLVLDPYNYLSTFHIDLNDYENIDIRRGLSVTMGNPTFNSATDIIGKWSYHINADRTNIGTHSSMCNKPAGKDAFWFDAPQNFIIYESEVGKIDPMPLVVNGVQGWGQQLNNPGLKLNYIITPISTASICNTGTPELTWDNLPGSCGSLLNNTIFTTSVPRARRTSNPLPGNWSTFVQYELVCGDPTICEVDNSMKYHFTVLIPGAPLGLNEVNENSEIKMINNISNSELLVQLKSETNYEIIDLAGRKVANGRLFERDSHVNIEGLCSGIYIIHFKNLLSNNKLIRKFQKI